MDSHGHLALGSYSAIMAVTCLLMFLKDLVRVEGVVLRVDQEVSMQWMECCQSDQLFSTKQGWNYTHCGCSNEASYKVELVCCEGGVGEAEGVSQEGVPVIRCDNPGTSRMPQELKSGIQ